MAVKIDNFSFSPATITVPAGTTMRWTNRDDIPHTVVSDDKAFKSKVLDTDEQFTYTFTKPGTYSYFCSIHPKMTAKSWCSEAATMNPFDPKSVLFARHAQHVVLIHFPIALCLVGIVFDFIAQWTKDRALAAVAYYNLLVAAIFTVPVVATGLLAWRLATGRPAAERHAAAPLMLGLAASGMIWLVWCLHLRAHRNPGKQAAAVSPAHRARRRRCGRSDRPSRRLSERGQRAGMDKIGNKTLAFPVYSC